MKVTIKKLTIGPPDIAPSCSMLGDGCDNTRIDVRSRKIERDYDHVYELVFEKRGGISQRIGTFCDDCMGEFLTLTDLQASVFFNDEAKTLNKAWYEFLFAKSKALHNT